MHPAFAESKRGPIFYWNLDDVVGLNGKNNWDDVLFVQWCLYKMARWTPAQQAWPVLSKVGVSGICSGRADDPLIATIKAAQAVFSGELDGKVHPITKSSKYTDPLYPGIKYVYLIMTMNLALAKMYPTQYPRLDLIPEFIWRVKGKVMTPFLQEG